MTVSFSQIPGTDEARREISATVEADFNAETLARADRRRKLAGLVRWLRAETRGTPASHSSSEPFRSIPLISKAWTKAVRAPLRVGLVVHLAAL